jgi:hypothetical protein
MENEFNPTQEQIGATQPKSSPVENSAESGPTLPEEIEYTLNTVESHFQKLETDLAKADTTIKEVSAMEPGSEEQYEAAYKMRQQIEDIPFADATIKIMLELAYTSMSFPIQKIKNEFGSVIGYSSEMQYPPEIETARQKFNELKSRYDETIQAMMVVWWDVKGKNEGGKSAEIANDYAEISKTDITPERAKEMLSSESLDARGKEYIATVLMRKLMDEGKDEDAADIALFAHEKRFYRTTNIDNLTADLATSIKYRNPNLYEKVKSILGPNTKPYI